MNIYYVDFENVSSQGLRGVDALTGNDALIVLYSKKADNVKIDILTELLRSQARIRFLPVHVGTPNALDFQLITLLFLGYSAENQHFIISKDSGYDCAVTTAVENGAVNVARYESVEEAVRGQLPGGKAGRGFQKRRKGQGNQNAGSTGSSEEPSAILFESAADKKLDMILPHGRRWNHGKVRFETQENPDKQAAQIQTEALEAVNAAKEQETPKAETPKMEAPQMKTAPAETAKAEMPKAEAPQVEEAPSETAKAEMPKAEASQVEEAPSETAKAEMPKAEVPQVEEALAETAKMEVPQAESTSADAAEAVDGSLTAESLTEAVSEEVSVEVPVEKPSELSESAESFDEIPEVIPEAASEASPENPEELPVEETFLPASEEEKESPGSTKTPENSSIPEVTEISKDPVRQEGSELSESEEISKESVKASVKSSGRHAEGSLETSEEGKTSEGSVSLEQSDDETHLAESQEGEPQSGQTAARKKPRRQVRRKSRRGENGESTETPQPSAQNIAAGENAHKPANAQAGENTHKNTNAQAGENTHKNTNAQAGEDTHKNTNAQAGENTHKNTNAQAGENSSHKITNAQAKAVIQKRCGLTLSDAQIGVVTGALRKSQNKQQFYKFFIKQLGQKDGLELYHIIKSAYTDLLSAAEKNG